MKKISHHNTGAPRKSEPKPTPQSQNLAAPTVDDGKEFCGHKEIRARFGISRSHLYRLNEERLIRSVSVCSRGRQRGRRLFEVASIRELLYRNLSQTLADVNHTQGASGLAAGTTDATHLDQAAR